MQNDRFKFRIYCNNHPLGPGYLCGKELLTMDGKILGGPDDPVECNGDYTIEQCTGLRDKRDNLVYEGDIIRARLPMKQFVVIGVVSWCAQSELIGWYVYNKNGDGWYLKQFHNKVSADHIDGEIIGNIHSPKYVKFFADF